MGAGTHIQGGNISNGEQLRKKEKAIIRPKWRSESGSLEKKRNAFGRKILFCRHAETQYRKPQEVNHAILDEFKIQDDVKMYIQLDDYDDFRVLCAK